jgi:hypothetical protein
MSEQDEAGQPSRRMIRAVKALVLFLGVLLVGGLGLVIHAISGKLAPKTGPATLAPPVAGISPAASFGPVTVPLGRDERAGPMIAAGDRILLRITGPAGERIVVLDPQGGRVAGSFTLEPAEAPAAR